MTTRAPLSAFVIAHNREELIGTCLRALAFADEIIVIDKGSTDATPAIAETLADRVIRVPWTPTVEETRAVALSHCSHDWVLFLDDDECLSPQAVRFLDAELAAPHADVYWLARRDYVLGLHDERAYYWPDHHLRCFHRGSVAFTATVHGGVRALSDRQYTVPTDSGACIHHLSHRDVAQFIEKTSRYTAQPDRLHGWPETSGLARFAHERIDHWLSQTAPCEPDSYPEAVAVLRAVYDLIDRLTAWQQAAGLDGARLFHAECARLDAAYRTLSDLGRPRAQAPSPNPLPQAGEGLEAPTAVRAPSPACGRGPG